MNEKGKKTPIVEFRCRPAGDEWGLWSQIPYPHEAALVFLENNPVGTVVAVKNPGGYVRQWRTVSDADAQ